MYILLYLEEKNQAVDLKYYFHVKKFFLKLNTNR